MRTVGGNEKEKNNFQLVMNVQEESRGLQSSLMNRQGKEKSITGQDLGTPAAKQGGVGFFTPKCRK